jgi:hypothetical protein
MWTWVRAAAVANPAVPASTAMASVNPAALFMVTPIVDCGPSAS